MTEDVLRVWARGEERNECAFPHRSEAEVVCAAHRAPQPLAQQTGQREPARKRATHYRTGFAWARVVARAAVMTVARVGAEAKRVPLARALPLSRVPPQLFHKRLDTRFV